MTSYKLSTFDLPTLSASVNRHTIGFDRLFDELGRTFANSKAENYPPYNIIKESDDAYIIELAIAGFKQDDIEIEMEKNVLTVKSVESEEPKVVPEYLHKGISARSFTRSFTLADHVEVLGATMQDGILAIQLQRKVPEALQPRKIAIEYTK